jgi:hypothetical protein
MQAPRRIGQPPGMELPGSTVIPVACSLCGILGRAGRPRATTTRSKSTTHYLGACFHGPGSSCCYCERGWQHVVLAKRDRNIYRHWSGRVHPRPRKSLAWHEARVESAAACCVLLGLYNYWWSVGRCAGYRQSFYWSVRLDRRSALESRRKRCAKAECYVMIDDVSIPWVPKCSRNSYHLPHIHSVSEYSLLLLF